MVKYAICLVESLSIESVVAVILVLLSDDIAKLCLLYYSVNTTVAVLCKPQ